MDSKPTFTLANTPFNLQITICIFLHPSDILALRKTCKALEIATRKRIVWVTVLRRICLDNTLFLPSFPIPDMSDLELEWAAMAPRRWIELCHGGPLKIPLAVDHNGQIPTQPRTTEIIHKGSVNSLFIVPGGRYLVTTGNKGLFVWDLGYASVSTRAIDCKLVASVENLQFRFCLVQATPDGMGLVILACSTVRPSSDLSDISIFEIYPQSEIPSLTQIASVICPEKEVAHLLPDTLILRAYLDHSFVFRIVDNRVNNSACFSADVDMNVINSAGRRDITETSATKTAIIVFCKEGILIWKIPPLSPHLPDRFLDKNPIHIPPVFKLRFPYGILRTHEILEWKTVSSWYFGSWESLFFDIIYTDSRLQRFKIIIEPDLSNASFHPMNKTKIRDDFMKSLEGPRYRGCEGYRICEDALVYFWINTCRSGSWGTYTGLTCAPFTNFYTEWKGEKNALSLSICPTSYRFVHSDYIHGNSTDHKIVVEDGIDLLL